MNYSLLGVVIGNMLSGKQYPFTPLYLCQSKDLSIYPNHHPVIYMVYCKLVPFMNI
jgi:hypothetical protein